MKKLNLAEIAVILFIALISTQFSYGQMERRGMHQGDHHKMMIDNLNLSDTQQEAVEELSFSDKRKMIELKADMEKNKLDMQELLSKGNYTRDDYLNTVKTINDAKEKIAFAKANHRMDVYDLLTEEQRKTFDEMQGRIGKKMKLRKMKDKS